MFAQKTLLSALTLGAGFASAVSLSANCQSSLKGLLTNPDAACLNVNALLQIAVTQDVPGTINNWLSGFCSGGSCSSDSISKVVANITGGCTEDLNTLGISASQGEIESTVNSIAQKAFPTVRKVVCLKDKSKDQFCPVELINNLEGIVGKLGIEDLSWFNLVQDVKTLLTSDKTKSELACSQCVKSAFSVAREDFGDVLNNSEVTGPVSDVCGADFVNSGTAGDLGENINQTASTAQFAAQAAAPNSAASPFSSAFWGLAAVAMIFAVAV